ncbi:MAG: hypothetical protein KBG80_04825 [Breznakibacter sp.]|nr:hypothetical protein [Breznakibacter sp.]
MSRIDISQIFSQFNNLNVLIIGDVMIDSYMWGDVTRISPEAPVPILSSTKREHRLGGAANVALNIQSLGANPILCSVIGDDESGKELVKLVSDKGFTTNGLVYDKSRITTIKTRIIAHNQHLLRVDEEIDTPLSPASEKMLLERIDTLLSQTKIDAIIFEDYDKGAITAQIIKHVTEVASASSIPVLVDPKKRNYEAYTNVTLFKPNFKEFKEGMKIDLEKGDQDGLLEAGRKFIAQKGIDTLMVTLSEHGVFVCQKDSYEFIPAEIRTISDVSGAGDTVISVSSLCLACGLSSAKVAKIGNLAGGLVCEKAGVVPIDKQQLLHECIEKHI